MIGKTIVAIDPSIISLGWATFDDNRFLQCCGVVTPPQKDTLANRLTYIKQVAFKCFMGPSEAVIEWPTHRKQGKRRSRADDLVKIAGAGCLFAAAFGAQRFIPVTPFEWKGNLPKEVIHHHMHAVLTQEEAMILDIYARNVTAKSKLDIYDAVSLGLFYLRRHTWATPTLSHTLKKKSSSSKRPSKKARTRRSS